MNGGPGISQVDIGTNSNAAGATLTITSNYTFPAGAFGVALVTEAGSTTAGTLADGTNTYTLASSQTVNGTGIGMIFICPNMSAMTNGTLTYTKHTTGTQASIAAFYATGLSASAGSGALDSTVTTTLSSASASPSLTSGAASVAGELIIAGCFVNNGAASLTYTQAATLTWSPVAGPPDNVNTQKNAQVAGGALICYGKGTTLYNPTLSGAPTGVALITIGIRPASTLSNGYNGVTPWTPTTSHVAGDIVKQKATVTIATERCFVCYNSTSGTGQTGAGEPTWVTTRGGQVTDSTVKWQEATGIAALNGDMTNTVNWATIKGTAVTLGQVIQNGAGTLIMLCTVAGTAGTGAEPSWPAYTTTGATIGDGGATWVTLGANNKYAIWSSVHSRLVNAYTANWGANGNTFFVAAAHAETQPTAMTATSPGTQALLSVTYCVANSPSQTPPAATDVTTGATVSITGNIILRIGGTAAFNGLAFYNGTGPASNQPLAVNNSSTWQRFDNCILAKLGGSVNGGSVTFVGGYTELWGTSWQPGAAGDGIGSSNPCTVRWFNSTFYAGTVHPTNWNAPGGALASLYFQGVDFSANTAGPVFGSVGITQLITCQDCKVAPGATLFGVPAAQYNFMDAVRTGSAGSAAGVMTRQWYEGSLATTTSIVRTGGASVSGTAVGWNMTTTANVNFLSAFESFPCAINNTTTGTGVVVTMYGVVNGSVVPTNNQCWLETEYLGTTGSPLGNFASTSTLNGLGSASPNTADSTSTWNSAAPARVNGSLYVAGVSVIAVNVAGGGGLFFCTVGGTASGSQPGGYATAIDGGAVTDGAATFRAGCRFSMSATVTPQGQGYVNAKVKLAQVSTTVYIDPLVVL